MKERKPQQTITSFIIYSNIFKSIRALVREIEPPESTILQLAAHEISSESAARSCTRRGDSYEHTSTLLKKHEIMLIQN